MNLFEIKFFHPCGWVWDSVEEQCEQFELSEAARNKKFLPT